MDKYFVDNDPYEWCLGKSKRLKAIDPQMNIQMRNHKLLTGMPGELENSVKCRCKQSCTLDEIPNTLQYVRKRKNLGKYSPYKISGFREKQPFRVEFKDRPRERVAEVTKKKSSCHNCGSTDQRKRRKSMPLRKSPRMNTPQRILNQTLWAMPSEKNLMKAKTQEKNF
ncbi:hypothetical protein O181_031024 [Austropuccinia psidii MF-1]|uniref:Uncharacterized protein n=1 Tax=Austropuccinia psidii MF-1 TaxID=1389203 RepID=A0A9Q3CU15_9BASI|nr:hypothetical protein [Austropuccinia psidii MF-1]